MQRSRLPRSTPPAPPHRTPTALREMLLSAGWDVATTALQQQCVRSLQRLADPALPLDALRAEQARYQVIRQLLTDPATFLTPADANAAPVLPVPLAAIPPP